MTANTFSVLSTHLYEVISFSHTDHRLLGFHDLDLNLNLNLNLDLNLNRNLHLLKLTILGLFLHL